MPPRGDPGFAHNTPVMAHAWSRSDGEVAAQLRDGDGDVGASVHR